MTPERFFFVIEPKDVSQKSNGIKVEELIRIIFKKSGLWIIP